MSKHDFIRLVQHVPLGLLSVLLITVSIPIGLMFAGSVTAYEFLNEWRKADSSYKDIKGFCWGLGIGGVIFAIWKFIEL